MGGFQELVLTCNLREDCPQQVIDVLNYLFELQRFETDDNNVPELPNHHFFTKWDGEWELFYGQDTPELPGDSFAKLIKDEYGYYKLTMRTMLKYGDRLAADFVHWIAPYSQTAGFVGYTRNNENPDIDLIYFEDGAAHYKEVEMWNTPPTVKSIKISKEKGHFFE